MKKLLSALIAATQKGLQVVRKIHRVTSMILKRSSLIQGLLVVAMSAEFILG